MSVLALPLVTTSPRTKPQTCGRDWSGVCDIELLNRVDANLYRKRIGLARRMTNGINDMPALSNNYLRDAYPKTTR